MANSEIRVGRISSVNYETGMARVTYRDKDESVTSEFPIITYNNEYRMPKIGQDVLVAHMSNGSSRGAIIGTLWNQKYKPCESGAELYRKDLSKEKDAAYLRYSDGDGEYTIKAANIHVNGVNATVLDGPNVEIAANISLIFQTEQMGIDIAELLVSGGDGGAVNIHVKSDIDIDQEGYGLKAIIQKASLKIAEGFEARTGTVYKVGAEDKVEITAGTEMVLIGTNAIKLSGSELELSDNTYHTTLKEIMERLEKLEG